ncbi:DNA-directed DNA polymerase II small subunit [Candidatus Micrarchaeota archaeon]|nr:DNA-directed DNA polymerase II small subunit [Candidatus Micrarchaeota archaeon]
MNQLVLDAVRQKQLIVQPQALELLSTLDNFEKIIEKLVEKNEFIVTREKIDEVISDISLKEKSAQVIVRHETGYRPLAKEFDSSVVEDATSDVTDKSTCKGKVGDFIEYFKDRLARGANIYKRRQSAHPMIPLSKLDSYGGKMVRVVGMVYEKKQSKNGHVIVELEDGESLVTCIAMKDSKAWEAASDLVYDEVIAFDGLKSRDLFVIKEVVVADVAFRQKKRSEEDVSVAFVSDLHIGSKFFLKDHFTKFLEFLNGKGSEKQREQASKIKYLLVAGDVVDGIGIYPSQEKELLTKDIFTQYEMFEEFMKSIPEYIDVIVCPGNHDAVRLAEPRPKLLPVFTKELGKFKNFHFVGSPALVKIHGFSTLMYHGDSIYSTVGAMSKLNGAISQPDRAAVEWLKKRHLSPIYGDNPIVPENKDYLLIDEAPDIFHFGHVHHNAQRDYRGTMIVNAGCWQDTTDYQLKQGYVPTQAILPIYDLHLGTLSLIDFKQDNSVVQAVGGEKSGVGKNE